MQKYAFLMWREPLLSMAELKSIFPSIVCSGDFAFIEAENTEIDIYKNSLWGTIKIALILQEWLKKNDILPIAVQKIKEKTQENKKLRIAIDSFVPSLGSLVFKTKDKLKELGYSIRVVQHDNWRVKTATTIHEKLIEQGIELMIFPDKNWFTIAETLWVQDIESYTQRDMNRDRSMTVGMMPPKIAQIMINLAAQGDRNILLWDPFCGLGTTLIEAFHSGFSKLYGSDLEKNMTEVTKKNMENQPEYEKSLQLRTFTLDAKNIDTEELPEDCIIATEWMLGTNFTSGTINQQSAFQERKKLTELYSWFLSSAFKNKCIKRISLCMPFWNIGKETLFMPEITMLCKEWSVSPLCIKGKRYMTHMRPGQCVGREIVLLGRQ